MRPSSVKALPYSKKKTRKTWAIWGSGALLAAFGLGFPVESVVISQGRVIPSDQIKAIQHLEGGIVSAVMVKEGETVKVGQPLVEIDLGGNSLNLEELTVRNAALQATRTRLLAEIQGKSVTRSGFGRDLDDSVYQAESGAYEARSLGAARHCGGGRIGPGAGQEQVGGTTRARERAVVPGSRCTKKK